MSLVAKPNKWGKNTYFENLSLDVEKKGTAKNVWYKKWQKGLTGR